MRKHVWIIISMSVLSLCGGWMYLGMFSGQVSHSTENLHAIIDEVEKDMGTYDPESARDESAIVRAKRVSELAQEVAGQHQRMMDSLAAQARADAESEIGYGSWNIDTSPKQPPKARVTEDGVLMIVEETR